MSIILSVNPPYAGNICKGLKRIEWRKHRLPLGKAYIYETKNRGGCGLVIGEAQIEVRRFYASCRQIYDHQVYLGMVDREFLAQYADGKPLFGHALTHPVLYDVPVPLSALLMEVVQSWCYISDDFAKEQVQLWQKKDIIG